MDDIANHFPAKNALGFCIHDLKLFPGVIPPDPRRNAPGAWTHTPISAWLASVPIVPVLRNYHCTAGNTLGQCVDAGWKVENISATDDDFGYVLNLSLQKLVLTLFQYYIC